MPVYYTEDHEWLDVTDGVATVGITNYAQEQLGDVVFVELPEEGAELAEGDVAATVESVKAASDVYCPLDGEIVESNDALSENPALVNEDAEGDAWFFKLKLSDPSEVEGLMSREAYDEHVA